MKTYRMSIEASICIDIEAESEKEAVEKATAFRDDHCDGVDINIGDMGRLYLDDDAVPDVEDITEYDVADDETRAYGHNGAPESQKDNYR